MRKNLFLLALSVLSVLSCEREISVYQEDSCFYADMENTVTKTFLNRNNVYWSGDDAIAVFTSGQKSMFTLASGANTVSGTFTGSITPSDTYYALYPYTEAAQLNSSVITTELPAIQTFRNGNIGIGQNLMVACSADDHLNFKNVSSLLKFEIISPNIGEIVFKGNNGEDIAGQLEISFEDGLPVCRCTDGQKSIVIRSEGAPFTPGVYYIAVLPNTFSRGISITLKPYAWPTDDVVLRCNAPSDFVKSSANPCTASRSRILPLGCIDQDAVWTYPSVKVNCLRDTGRKYGQYIDLNTGRTFFALGANSYCNEVDLAFMQWNGAGFCSIQSASTLSIVNTTNLGRYGLSVDNRDVVSNWQTRNITDLCYLPEMTDEQYRTLTASGIQAIYRSCSPAVQYFSNSDSEGKNLTNARIQGGSQKYCLFRTGNANEGIAIGVMKFTGVNGTSGAWEVAFDYKCAYIKGEKIFEPDQVPIHSYDEAFMIAPYGVCANPAAGDEKQYGKAEVEQIKAMGAGWIREDFTWGWINSSPGNWNYTFMDNNVAYAQTVGVDILPILCYDQTWATPLVDHLDDWLEYVTNVVTRYKKQLRVWEVYNEPNHKNYWHSESPNGENYTRVLKATYECIKGIDPELQVLFGGLAGTGFEYAETCFAAGAGNYCDAMNFHPYNITGKPEKLISDIATMRGILARNGCADKPLWITEIGWTSPVPLVKNGVSEQTQAEYVPRAFMCAFAGGVGKTFWFQYRSPEKRASTDADFYRDHYGLVHSDLTTKPAYDAYRTLTTMLPSDSTRPVLTNSGDIYLCHWKNPDGENVWAFWNGKDATSAANISFTGTITSACGLFGESVSISAGSVQVHSACTYVVGPETLTIE